MSSVALSLWREQLFPAGLGGTELTLRFYAGTSHVGSEVLVDPDGPSEAPLLVDPDGGFLLGFGREVQRYR